MIIFLALLACKDQTLIDENDKLKQRVGDLERANKRLEQDLEATKAQVARAESENAAADRAGQAAAVGFEPGKKLSATFETSMGNITCTLRPDEAPATVQNFVQLARGEKEWTDPATRETTTRPLYDGTIFHRVIPDFMIQGGDPLGRGTGGPGYKFADEVGDFTKFDKPGLLAMANSGPDTNGSQFFITEGTPTHLNRKHTIFGDCENLDVVAKIARVEKDRRDKPTTDVVIKRVTISAK